MHGCAQVEAENVSIRTSEGTTEGWLVQHMCCPVFVIAWTFALTTFANWTLLFWNTQSSVQPPIMGWTEPHSRHQHIRLQHTIKGTWEKIFGCNTTTTLIIYIQLLLGVWGRLLTVCTSTQSFLMWKSHWESKMWLNLNICKTCFFFRPNWIAVYMAKIKCHTSFIEEYVAH